MERVLNETFASVLQSGRAEFNARFAEARRLYPDLDSDAFSQFLRTTLNDLAGEVEKVAPTRAVDFVMAAYDVALELIAQRLVGSGARVSVIEDGWNRILPKIAPMLAESPESILQSVSNALHHLSTTPGAREADWVAEMERLGPQCEDANAFLTLGQVVAWHAGLAHFREGALAAADALPEALALGAVGAGNGAKWPEVKGRLLADPWFDPAASEQRGLRVATRAGGFRGFGGLFVEPPTVASLKGQFFAWTNDSCWLLTADAFGATFHRATPEEFDAVRKQPENKQNARMAAKLDFVGDLGEITSAATSTTSLALTGSHTHAILLVALA